MANNLDTNTKNNDIGIFITRSDFAVVDEPFGFMASFIKAKVAGRVVWENSETGEIGVWDFEAGEPAHITCDKILSSGTTTIKGNAVTTTITGAEEIIFGVTGNNIGKEVK